MRRRKRPSTPAEIAERKRDAELKRMLLAQSDAALEDAGFIVRSEIAALEDNPDLRVVRDERGDLAVAQRLDVFELLRSRKALSDPEYFAARRLEEDMLIAQWQTGVSAHGGRIDCHLVNPKAHAAIEAQGRMTLVLRDVGIWYRDLLLAVLSLTGQNSLITRWRDTVRRVTGEDNDRVQTALVRHACRALAHSYAELDYGRLGSVRMYLLEDA